MPCVVGATDLPMEGEGKAAGEQGGGSSFWLVVEFVCCVLCVVLCLLV